LPLEHPVTFEAQFKKLETILERLEEGDLSLDASLKEYEKGIKTLRSCHEILEGAERRIEELTPGGLKPVEAD
jgi:exodeoxyribonuclease VII small subunit